MAPVLAFAVSASSFSALRCSLTGMLVAESCCPSAAESGPPAVPSPLDSVGDPSCCLRVVVAMDKIPAAGAPGAKHVSALVASLPDLPPGTGSPSRLLASGRGRHVGDEAARRPPGLSAHPFPPDLSAPRRARAFRAR